MATSIVRNSDVISVLRGEKKKDKYNAEFVDWTTPQTVVTGRGSVQNFLGTEDDTDRQTTTEGNRLISDDPALFYVILPTDRVVYDGMTFEVDSAVQLWRLFGRPHHIEVNLKRVIG